MTEFDTENTEEIICPYCEREQSDLANLFGFMGNGQFGMWNCERCGREFDFTCNVVMTFTTTKKDTITGIGYAVTQEDYEGYVQRRDGK